MISAHPSWTQLLSLLVLLGTVQGGMNAYAISLAVDAKQAAVAARPDPFTGTDGRALKHELIQRDGVVLDTLRREIDRGFEGVRDSISDLRSLLREHMPRARPTQPKTDET